MLENQSVTDESVCAGWTPFCENIPVRMRLIAFACQLLPGEDKDSAEDIVQEALYRAMSTTDPARIADKLNFLFKVIQNLCFDRYRSRRPPASVVSLDRPLNYENEHWYLQLRDLGRDPELNAEMSEHVEILLHRLARNCADLTGREKKLLMLHIEGWTNDEIACAWREDVKVIRVDMNAVLAKIRYRLQRKKERRDCF